MLLQYLWYEPYALQSFVLPCPVSHSLKPLPPPCPFLHLAELSCAAWAGSLPGGRKSRGILTALFISSPPSWCSLPFSPQNMAEEQSHSRSVVSGKLWFLGREQRKGFFPPVAEEMIKAFHRHFELQLLLLGPLLLIYSKITVRGLYKSVPLFLKHTNPLSRKFYTITVLGG